MAQNYTHMSITSLAEREVCIASLQAWQRHLAERMRQSKIVLVHKIPNTIANLLAIKQAN